MERVGRIDGEKYHLNQLTNEELESMRQHAILRVSNGIADIDLLESEICLRRPEEQLTLQYGGWTDQGEYLERE